MDAFAFHGKFKLRQNPIKVGSDSCWRERDRERFIFRQRGPGLGKWRPSGWWHGALSARQLSNISAHRPFYLLYISYYSGLSVLLIKLSWELGSGCSQKPIHYVSKPPLLSLLKRPVIGAHCAKICTPSFVLITSVGSNCRLRSLHHNNVLWCRASGHMKGCNWARRTPQLQWRSVSSTWLNRSW